MKGKEVLSSFDMYHHNSQRPLTVGDMGHPDSSTYYKTKSGPNAKHHSKNNSLLSYNQSFFDKNKRSEGAA